jgi:putative transposon-encoded protein
MSEMEIKTKGYAVIQKTVKPSGNGAMVYIPKEWIGKRVKIILIDK